MIRRVLGPRGSGWAPLVEENEPRSVRAPNGGEHVTRSRPDRAACERRFQGGSPAISLTYPVGAACNGRLMSETDMSFGLVLTATGSGRAWAEQASRAEQQGWSSLLVPDTLWTPSPFPTLAAAAAVTSTVRLRTWVLAAPLRSAAAVAREAASLQVLSDGRFDLGIGSGRPDAEHEAAQLGLPWGSPADRIRQVEDVIVAVREKVSPTPKIVVAAAGPRMLVAAARSADRVALALPPMAGHHDLAAAADRVRAAAPGTIGLSQQLSGLAGRLPAWLTRGGLDPRTLAAAGAVGMLVGDAAAMADTLRGRREELGIDEIIVPGELADEFAPVIRRLAG